MQIGGEPVYRSDVELFQRHFPASCVLVQLLGATEVQNYAYHFMDRYTRIVDGHTVPLAFDPIEGTAVLLLDEAGEEVGVGRPGEISVRSRHIALGYWRRPDLTEAAFVPDPRGGDERISRTGDLGIRHPDDHLEHVGRKDLQIKIRGFRVEGFRLDLPQHLLLEADPVAGLATLVTQHLAEASESAVVERRLSEVEGQGDGPAGLHGIRGMVRPPS